MQIQVNDLTHAFPEGGTGIDRLSLTLDSGNFTILTGANGSGKTLLIRHILGLEAHSESSILLDGQPAARCLKELRRRIALVFQEPEHQILGLTVKEDLEISIKSRRLSKQDAQSIFDETLKICGLSGQEEKLCTFLSGGEKRRLAIASAAAQGAEVLILDEPFNDLDWKGTHDLLRLILDLRSRGIGIWLVTHDLEKCLAHADRLVVMEQGRIKGDAHPDELWNQLPSWGIRRLSGHMHERRKMTWLMDPGP